MAKKNQDEYIAVYYGIHIDTCDVKSVWVTRGGKMSGDFGTHQVIPGRDVKSELIIVFSLADTIQFTPAMLDSPSAKREIEELKAKAVEMKKKKTPPQTPPTTP